MHDNVHILACFQCGSHSSIFLGVYRLKANAGNSRCAGSPCVFHIWTSLLLYFDSKFQEVLPCTKRLCNNLFIDDTGPLLFCSLSCDSEGITSTYNHSLHSVRQLQKDSFTEVCWISKWANTPATLLALTSPANYRTLVWEQTRAPLSAPEKNGLFYFPRFSVGGWHHFECGFVVQTTLFYFFFQNLK